jgi:hypothetical protein
MRFDIEVHWNPDGLLEGDVRPSGEATPTPFWGITELIGLLQTQLGPAALAGGSPGSAAAASGHGSMPVTGP